MPGVVEAADVVEKTEQWPRASATSVRAILRSHVSQEKYRRGCYNRETLVLAAESVRGSNSTAYNNACLS